MQLANATRALARIILTLSASLALSAAVAQATSGPASDNVAVVGDVTTALNLKPSDLKAFPAEHIGTLTLSRRVDGKERSTTVRGVKLSALIERAGLAHTGHNDWKHMVVIATATDGYRVAFSWPELTNTDVGASVLVIFERDGEALDDGEGRIALVSGRDLRAGPRHVKWLNKIELKML